MESVIVLESAMAELNSYTSYVTLESFIDSKPNVKKWLSKLKETIIRFFKELFMKVKLFFERLLKGSKLINIQASKLITKYINKFQDIFKFIENKQKKYFTGSVDMKAVTSSIFDDLETIDEILENMTEEVEDLLFMYHSKEDYREMKNDLIKELSIFQNNAKNQTIEFRNNLEKYFSDSNNIEEELNLVTQMLTKIALIESTILTLVDRSMYKVRYEHDEKHINTEIEIEFEI